MFVRDEQMTETWEEPASDENATTVLRPFASAEAGGRVDVPPAWKCRACEFKHTCPLLPAAVS